MKVRGNAGASVLSQFVCKQLLTAVEKAGCRMVWVDPWPEHVGFRVKVYPNHVPKTMLKQLLASWMKYGRVYQYADSIFVDVLSRDYTHIAALYNSTFKQDISDSCAERYAGAVRANDQSYGITSTSRNAAFWDLFKPFYQYPNRYPLKFKTAARY